MKSPQPLILPCLQLVAFLLLAPATATSLKSAPIDFARDIRPILSDRCFRCHGPDGSDRQSDLRLDDEASAKADREGRRVIAAGNSAASELIRRITSNDPDEKMPPSDSGKELRVEEIALLKQWIDEGADWGQHWAYVKPIARPLPVVADTTWTENWIDRFLLAKIEAAELRPAPDADPRTFVRRLAFDLTGLPPSPELIETFVQRYRNAPRGPAISQLVDQLLATPHFGERMAFYWLDLVRYADTVGYHGDQDHSISPYRDYVINAFNDDLPFDRFTHEQIAGDLIPGFDPDRQIATGYNRLLQTTHEGGLQPKEYLAIYAADRVRNISTVWMGATLGCAQCHDHKFDPYTTRDFYTMAAFFADIDEESHFKTGSNELPTQREPEATVFSRVERERLAKLEHQLAAAQRELDSSPSEDTRKSIQQQIRRMEARQRIWQQQARRTMITASLQTPRVTRILPRGNWLDESGAIVEAETPAFLHRLSSTESSLATSSATEPAATGTPRATRLVLARWLTDSDKGIGLLTARVMVNRLWYQLFGAGLCRSLDDFGGQGQPPDHPELLDQLAIEFVRSGWDVKHMVRLIVSSHAYRQSSNESADYPNRDPQNRWLARQNRFRLPAEMVRDVALSVSGLLVHEVGGASARPYQPEGYYRHLNFPERTYNADTNTQQWRRGLYIHWQRTYLHPTLRALDAPTREECTAERTRSNTPLAALAMLNDPSFVEAARVFATRLLLTSPNASDEVKLHRAVLMALGRPPEPYEIEQLRQLLIAEREQYALHPEEAGKVLAIGISQTPVDLVPSELASWTAVTRTLLNLHETITRN